MSFCGFRKPHPHSTDSIIRVAFHNQIDKVGVSGYFQGACDSAINAFTKLVEQFGGEVSKKASYEAVVPTTSSKKLSSKTPAPVSEADDSKDKPKMLKSVSKSSQSKQSEQSQQQSKSSDK